MFFLNIQYFVCKYVQVLRGLNGNPCGIYVGLGCVACYSYEGVAEMGHQSRHMVYVNSLLEEKTRIRNAISQNTNDDMPCGPKPG